MKTQIKRFLGRIFGKKRQILRFDDPLRCYEAIADALNHAVNDKWKTIYLEALLDGASIDMLITYEKSSGEMGSISYVPMLARYFYELAKLVSTPEKGLYKRCDFVLKNDGSFDVKFEY